METKTANDRKVIAVNSIITSDKSKFIVLALDEECSELTTLYEAAETSPTDICNALTSAIYGVWRHSAKEVNASAFSEFVSSVVAQITALSESDIPTEELQTAMQNSLDALTAEAEAVNTESPAAEEPSVETKPVVKKAATKKVTPAKPVAKKPAAKKPATTKSAAKPAAKSTAKTGAK